MGRSLRIINGKVDILFFILLLIEKWAIYSVLMEETKKN